MEIQDNHRIKDVGNGDKDIRHVHHSKGRRRHMHLCYCLADYL